MLSRTVPVALFAASLTAVLALPAGALAGPCPRSTFSWDQCRISISVAPAAPRAGGMVDLSAGEGGTSYAWDLDGDGAFDDASGKDVTASFPAGVRTVRARTTTAGGVTTDSATFDVHAWNVRPGGKLVLEPRSARVGAPVKVTADGADADGPAPRIDLDLDGDGTFETEGSKGTATFATAGDKVIRARFTDDAGATSVATQTIDVHTGNLAPAARVEIPPVAATGAAKSAAADSSGWVVNAADPDGSVVRYEFDLDGDGTFETDGGADRRVPMPDRTAKVLGVRVTDDAGAIAVMRTSGGPTGGPWRPSISLPLVAQAGVPVTLKADPETYMPEWDADGDGDFDDGTTGTIAFTYPSPGTYEVRLKQADRVGIATISVRDAADMPGPLIGPLTLPVGRPGAARGVWLPASGPPGTAETPTVGVDLDGDGQYGDATAPQYGSVSWVFAGPVTVRLKATDARGRSSVATGDLPFSAGDLAPAAQILTSYRNDAPGDVDLWTVPFDPDGPEDCCTVAWDLDGDGAFDDGAGWTATARGPAVGLRVTDAAGLSTTVTRAIGLPPQPRFAISPVLGKPHLATLRARGLLVRLGCSCRGTVVATVDRATAKRLKLRSRTVGRGSGKAGAVRVKLTKAARKALRGARSVKLTLSIAATSAAGERATAVKTATIRR